MLMQRMVIFTAATTFALAVAAPLVAEAGGQNPRIDYGMLSTGKKAPPGAKAKLRHAAELALKGKHCAKVVQGFYIPPDYQWAPHKGEAYMV